MFDRYIEETRVPPEHGVQRQPGQSEGLLRSRCTSLEKLKKFLSLPANKVDLAHFLSEELCYQAPEDKEIVVAGGFRLELEVRSSRTSTDLTQLKAAHEEVDTRLLLHAVHSQFHTVVSSRDSDVLVPLASHFLRVQCKRL